MRIKLIVTGDLEKKAMVQSIRRFFPSTYRGEDVEWLAPRKVNAITTKALDLEQTQYEPMRKLVRAMAAEAEDGSDGRPADLVIAIDDLELANQAQPEVVTAQVRRHVEAEIQRRQFSMEGENRFRALLRAKCSFHLFAPMVETYFFGDGGALFRAGVARARNALLISPDVEDFETNDPDFLPCCREENQRHAQKILWWKHERHPKHYLGFLVQQNGGLYDEVLGGAAAFCDLAWSTVPFDRTATPFARSLFQDIADALGPITNPLGEGEVAFATYPARNVRREQLLLRNM